MKKIWSYITYLASFLTLSPVSRDDAQQPLSKGPTAKPITIHNEPSVVTIAKPFGRVDPDVLEPQGRPVVNEPGVTYPLFVPPTADTADSGYWEGHDFKCDYSHMEGYKPCSTPNDRTCWLYNEATGHTYSTKSDYENDHISQTPTGIWRNYTLIVTDGEYNADGLVAKNRILVNGTYPGPRLHACWGDWVSVKVINKLEYNGTAVHFHGVRQYQSMHMDGVPGITQCPIAPHDYFDYQFRVLQYGSSWYHSHYSVQYADGLLGGLTFHGPSSDNYDDTKEPILMSDWFHNSAFSVIHNKHESYPTVLVNGVGDVTKHMFYPNNNKTQLGYHITPNAPIKPKFKMEFVPGKRYLLRLINTSFTTTFIFSIDHHKLIIVSADFVPLDAIGNRTHVTVGIGQRYNVIVVAEPHEYVGANLSYDYTKEKNFWMRTRVANCFQRSTIGIRDYDETGIIRYGKDDIRSPVTEVWPKDVVLAEGACKDETNLKPTLEWDVGEAVNNNGPKQGGEHFGEEFSASKPGPNDLTDAIKKKFPLASWAMDPIEKDQRRGPWNPLQIDYEEPIFLELNDFNKSWKDSWMVIPENFDDNKWIYLAITGMNQRKNPQSGIVAHPMHLHGHDFAVLQQEDEAKFPPDEFNFTRKNPLRRDVVLLPAKGWVVVAFKADNPGNWIMHCHIAFHASEGLALQINERQETANKHWPQVDEDGNAHPAITEARRVCKRWKDFHHDCTQHWPGKDHENNCWPACSPLKDKEKAFACPEKKGEKYHHVFMDDSGI